jgi:hypothetical protein
MIANSMTEVLLVTGFSRDMKEAVESITSTVASISQSDSRIQDREDVTTHRSGNLEERCRSASSSDQNLLSRSDSPSRSSGYDMTTQRNANLEERWRSPSSSDQHVLSRSDSPSRTSGYV